MSNYVKLIRISVYHISIYTIYIPYQSRSDCKACHILDTRLALALDIRRWARHQMHRSAPSAPLEGMLQWVKQIHNTVSSWFLEQDHWYLKTIHWCQPQNTSKRQTCLDTKAATEFALTSTCHRGWTARCGPTSSEACGACKAWEAWKLQDLAAWLWLSDALRLPFRGLTGLSGLSGLTRLKPLSCQLDPWDAISNRRRWILLTQTWQQLADFEDSSCCRLSPRPLA